MAAPSAPSSREEMEGRENLRCSSTGGESGGCGEREYDVGMVGKYEPSMEGLNDEAGGLFEAFALDKTGSGPGVMRLARSMTEVDIREDDEV